MRAHQIENGVVVNTIEVESLDFLPNLIEATEGSIGWLWDGENFIAPVAPPAPVPQQVTMRQACLALENAGILDDVEALVATLPRPYQIEWERASVVQRDNMLVEVVRAQQGMTTEQIDDLFRQAETL
jgi:hypothetical protein